MTKPTSNDTAARRVAYSLAAGAAASLTATEADAQIVWSTPQDLAINQFSSQGLNLDGDAYTDIQLKNYAFPGGNYQGAYVYFLPGKTIGFQQSFAYATSLQPGDPIDATTAGAGFATTSLAYGASNPNAQFNNAQGAYIGLSFPINATLHYGWVRVSIDNAAGTFVIHDWAYNSVPGEPINAGQIAGDYNGDGLVDAADYTVWRDTYDSTDDLRADGDANGMIDDGDYLVWTEDYGFSAFVPGVPTPPEVAPSLAVPEPATLGLLACGAAGLGLLRRSRRAHETNSPSEQITR